MIPCTFISNLQQSSPSSINLNPTNVYEIVNLINSLQINKASGFNDISPYFLKIGADILAYPLTDLFNYCISFGIFPQQLKIAKVIPIHESGPLDNVGNYRPISLLTSLSKIFERLLHKRLVSFFEKNNTLVLTQFGFRHHHSTLHSILDIITNCYDCIQGKKFVNLIFLDIKKAFDSVSHYKLLKKLEHYGIRGVANQLLQSYLSERKQFVSINNDSSSLKSINFGVPQGSILGPLLFLIYIKDLPNCLHTVTRFFADDTTLIFSSDNINNLQRLANSELHSVTEWMLTNSITINPTKTISLLISPNYRKSSLNYSCFLNDDQIDASHYAKYLGIILDDRLSFKAHIEFVETKISRSVGIMSKLSYYLPTETLITLYYALIHSHIFYGLPVWASTFNTYLNKLRKLQNRAMRIITKSKIKDRITPQYVHLGILKLNDLYNFEIAKFLYQYVHDMLPLQFNHYFTYMHDAHSHTTRNSTSKALAIKRFSTNRGQNSIKYKGATIWNSIPNQFKLLT